MSRVVLVMCLSPLSVLPVLAAIVAGSVLTGGPAAAVTPSASATPPALSWDFDGDGIRDLAAGQVGNEEGGPGQVLVRRGTADGYGPATVLRHPEAPEGNEGFGSSLASTDLDLDGYADLVVGAPGFYPAPGRLRLGHRLPRLGGRPQPGRGDQHGQAAPCGRRPGELRPQRGDRVAGR